MANLIDVFLNERLLVQGTTKGTTGCDWYNDLKCQRDYFTHVGFPMFYMNSSGEWRVPIEPRSQAPTSNLADTVPSFCSDIFDNVHRFMGLVYAAVAPQ